MCRVCRVSNNKNTLKESLSVQRVQGVQGFLITA
jgi:hypothetical protein